MTTRDCHSTARPGLARLMLSSFVAAILLLAAPLPASAQISRLGGVINSLVPGGIMRGTDTAYDPVHGVYLLVVGNGPVYGVFVNVQGVPVTPRFTIMSTPGTWAHFPRAVYSPDILGGQGGFLVTWHHNIDTAGAFNCVFGRIVSVSIPGGLVTGIQQISDGSQQGSWHETGPAMAYSRTSHRFLVAWRTKPYGILGRFVDVNGVPFGGILPLENPGGSRDPALAWNAATNEFGLVYTGFGTAGAFASFRRIRASDGVVSGRTSFGFGAGTFATAIDVNSSNQYVLAWALHPGTMSAVFDQNGTLLGSHFVTNRLGFDQSLGMAFNPTTQTLLAVSSDLTSYEVGAVEMNAGGIPVTGAQLVTDGARLGSFYPMTTTRTATNQWDVVYARDFQGAASQIVQAAAIGVPPPPPPPPPPTGCTTPDPFRSLGGGRCVNGGWLPPTGAAPPPPPPPPTSSCRTPDPFVSLGGGRCLNGGWLPPDGSVSRPPTAPPPPPSGGCATPDPFAAIGGGTCVNGGWVPTRSACPTADPFVSLGGGLCVNGGWVPRTSGNLCTTADPFASIGGGTCVGGGWVPRRARLDERSGPAFGPDGGLANDLRRAFARAEALQESRPV